MSRKRTMRPEERALWTRVAKSVKPLSDDRMTALEAPEPKPPAAPEKNKMDTAARAYETGLRLPPTPRRSRWCPSGCATAT